MTPHDTIFARMLRLVPRQAFDKLAREHHVGAPLRGMSRWQQLVALVAGQLTGRQSLRDKACPRAGGSRTRGRRC